MLIYILLVLSGLATGFINSVAGGGGIVLYPILQILGLPLLITNATITAASSFGSLSSVYGYKKYLKKLPKRYFLVLIPCLIGAVIGSTLLLHTSNNKLKLIIPALILIAVILTGLQPEIHRIFFKRKAQSRKYNPLYLIIFSSTILLTAIYGGYFGAGFGIIILAILGLSSMRNIQTLNGLKNLSSAVITLSATTVFSFHHLIDWHYAEPLIIGTILGGYIGSKISAKIPTKYIRLTVVVIGVIVAIYLLIKPV